MLFYAKTVVFSAVFFALSAFAPGQVQAAIWSKELGNPIYVLKTRDSKTMADSEFQIFELRPSEREALRFYSGSQLLITSSAFAPKAFGFVGHSILADRIEPGLAVVLDQDGNLWRTPVSYSGVSQNPTWEQILGRYKVLEQDASRDLYAVNFQNELVRILETGEVEKNSFSLQSLLRAREEVLQVRSNSETIFLLTSQKRLLVLNSKFEMDLAALGFGDAEFEKNLLQVYLDEKGVWVLGAKSARLVHKSVSGDVRSADLTLYLENRQDSRKFEILGARDGALYFRGGVNFFKAYPNTANSGFSIDIIAPDFFASGIREMGVITGLHTSVSAMQPRDAERNGVRRSDFLDKRNPGRQMGVDENRRSMTYDEIGQYIKDNSEVFFPHLIRYANVDRFCLSLDVIGDYRKLVDMQIQDAFKQANATQGIRVPKLPDIPAATEEDCAKLLK